MDAYDMIVKYLKFISSHKTVKEHEMFNKMKKYICTHIENKTQQALIKIIIFESERRKRDGEREREKNSFVTASETNRHANVK